jgi:hypothetical protein
MRIMAKPVIVIGEVSELGYTVRVLDAEGKDVREEYSAGNNQLDSGIGQSVPVGHPQAESKDALFFYAVETAREIAEENHVECIDVRYEEDW